MKRKLFRVSITKTESAELLVVADSAEAAEEAVRLDFNDNPHSWFLDDGDVEVSSYEERRPQRYEKDVQHAELDGSLWELSDPEYLEKLRKKETDPVPDTVTIPLFHDVNQGCDDGGGSR